MTALYGEFVLDFLSANKWQFDFFNAEKFHPIMSRIFSTQRAYIPRPKRTKSNTNPDLSAINFL